MLALSTPSASSPVGHGLCNTLPRLTTAPSSPRMTRCCNYNSCSHNHKLAFCCAHNLLNCNMLHLKQVQPQSQANMLLLARSFNSPAAGATTITSQHAALCSWCHGATIKIAPCAGAKCALLVTCRTWLDVLVVLASCHHQKRMRLEKWSQLSSDSSDAGWLIAS